MFVSKEELIALVPIITAYIQDDANFAIINSTVSGVIAEHTGIEIPDSPADAPEWAKLAACKLLYSNLIPGNAQVSDALIEDARLAYKDAIAILDRHRIKQSAYSIFKSIEIKERFKW